MTDRTGAHERKQLTERRRRDAKANARADKTNNLRFVTTLPGQERLLRPYYNPTFGEITAWANERERINRVENKR